MKEATGELNVAVVVAVAIGALSAFFYFILWPMIKANMNATTQCSKAICEKCPSTSCKTVSCHLPNDSNTFECVWKG